MPYKNKEDKKAYDKKYRENNKEHIRQRVKAYHKTPTAIKSKKISEWRFIGVIETEQYTFDELYETYLYHTNCEECDVELTTGRFITKTTKCLDHDHETGKFRDILCHSCNVKRR